MTDYTFETPRPVALVIKNLGGKVSVRAVDDGTTRVSVVGSLADEVACTQQGDAISVIAPHCDWMDGGLLRNWFRRHRIDITVCAPTGSDITLRLGGGETEIIGRFGRVEVRPGAGEVHMTDAAGETFVQVGAGTITVDTISAPTKLIGGAGNIRIGQAGGDTSLQLGTGDVSIQQVTAPVYIKSGAGNVSVASVTGAL
ncbi:MAG: hypothetical protein FWF28_08930, partial [Micrococcales bacterium]|nr:hypothetical protein [Micrococcales bacterium]